MQISIDTGVKTIEIVRNGEHVGDVRFSLSDPSLLNRLRTVSKKAEEIQNASKLDSLGDDIEAGLDEAVRIDGEIRALLDWAFAAPVSDIVFGESFSFTSSNGVTAVEQFLDGVMPYLEECFAEETRAAQKRQKAYLEKYRK